MSPKKKKAKKPRARKRGGLTKKVRPVSVDASLAPDLTKLRARIDDIDNRVLALLSERASIAQEVGRAKDGTGAPIHVPERERAILSRIEGLNRGPLGKQALESIYREIFSACLSMERELSIAFLGPETTYSHQAAIQHFGHQPRFQAAASIDEVFDAVERKQADYGVVPVENSTEGSVNITLDRLISTPASICAEVIVPIHHHFMRAQGASGKVARIYSHPQVFAQCRAWLRDHHPGVEQVTTASTAQAAAQAADDKEGAALASHLAAEKYSLSIEAENVEDRSENRTRFLVLGRQVCAPSGADKTTLLIAVKDEPGVLFRMLQPFAREKVSLTRIESRPSRGKAWEYVFLVDLAGHIEERSVARALAQVEKHCRQVKVLGSYPRAF